jgi:hypothetical protein
MDESRCCPKCKETKGAPEFNMDSKTISGLSCYCKTCNRAYQNKWMHEHAQQRREYDKRFRDKDPAGFRVRKKVYGKSYREGTRGIEARRLWILNNPEKIKKMKRESRLRNIEAATKRDKEYRERYPEMIKARKQDYSRRNRHKINAAAARNHRRRMATRPDYRIKIRIRSRLRLAWSGCKGKATQEAMNLLGCTMESFKMYLESRWESGMSWENYGRGIGKWNIDHDMPIAFFDMENEEHRRYCFHFSNLKPMWAIPNCIKNDNVTSEQIEEFNRRLALQREQAYPV